MRLSRSYPEIENTEILEKFYEKGQPAMFVANHNSWMDIPFLGATIGWRNYKMISKKELGRVPILGTAIKVAGNIMVDRSDRRSQIRTLKQGINYLKVSRMRKRIKFVGVHSLHHGASHGTHIDSSLFPCTYPEWCSPVHLPRRNSL